MTTPDSGLPQLTFEQEEAVAANYLARLAAQEPDRLPLNIFLPVASLVVTHTVEVGFVKPLGEEDTLVLLTQRPADDPFWASQWHIPGSVVRATDPVKHEHDYDAAFSRVVDEIGGGIHLTRDPVKFDTVRRKSSRGSEVTVRLLAEVEGDPVNGMFFDAAEVLHTPPEGGLIETHAAAIQKVVDSYLLLRNG